MVVQHNMQAANTNRQLGITSGAQAKSTEKLSSGYKINRAADDAAGLSISEKMRSQIRGLDRASTNASDGISVVQTAEGALNEVHSILQRMNELATQAANDTNTSIDRSAIKAEIDELTSEIDRIASTTQFNTMNLLDGNFTGKNLQVGSLSGQNIKLDISSMKSTAIGITADNMKVTSFTSAGTAMTKIQSAIDIVSTQRSKLGATQNRLEHTIANLDTTSENTSSAESRIRDTDMAKEMVT
nr:flagellin [Lachnospiraceae bacterium]